MTGPPALPLFERALSRAMLAGVWSSATLLAAGLLLTLSGADRAAGHMLRAGLLILMGTPVMRIVLSVAEAIRQRDWFWLWTTVAVAVVLAGTLAYSLLSAP